MAERPLTVGMESTVTESRASGDGMATEEMASGETNEIDCSIVCCMRAKDFGRRSAY